MSGMITANIERAYVDMFKEGFEHSFQQKMSKLRPLVQVERQGSEFEFYDRIGLADDMNEVTSRYEDSPLNEVPHERRRIGLRDFDWGKLIDDKDLIRVASDPTNAYTQAALAAANRRIDDLIIEGFTAPAYIGKKGATTVSFVGTTAGDITVGAISNENGQISTGGDFTVTAGNFEGIDVAADYRTSGTTSNITTEKLIGIRETLLRLEACDETDMLPCLVSPAQQSSLLRQALDTSNVPALISRDYNKPVLQNGFVDTWLGFKFIYTNRLPKSGDVRSCFVLGPKGMKLGISKDLSIDIYRRPDKKNIPYILIKMGMGVSRMWGEHVVRVRCDETK
jgi:hypothetical protein